MGPSETPYEKGFYFLTLTYPESYPMQPPIAKYCTQGLLINPQTNAQFNVRFNPNLYNCGKVCLSLLGTWTGDKGESWNSLTSTFFQILVSIQSQILIEEPFFNEPGYERQIGKELGKKSSKDYNDNIRQYNLDYAINGLIEDIILNKSSYLEFEYIIRNYFKFKRDRIINILNKKDKVFRRINEYDMLMIKEIDFNKIYSDLSYEIILPHGRVVNVISRPLVEQNHMLQKILDMGIPYMENNKECFGTLYVIYKIVYPKTLDKVEIVEPNEKNADLSDSYNSYECEYDELFKNE